jgi:hypothetical protein
MMLISSINGLRLGHALNMNVSIAARKRRRLAGSRIGES